VKKPEVPALASLTIAIALLVSTPARADDAPIATSPAPATTQTPAAAAAPAPASASCTVDPCASACACAARCCGKCGCAKPKLQLSLTGVRFAVTHVDAGPVNETTIGAGFAGSAETYALDGLTHAQGYFMLGGGQGGFEGALASSIDIGYRIPLAEEHGPFGRIGIDGRIQGNDLLYFSMLELPRIAIGWQYLKGKNVFEAGARGGAILAGLYDPGEAGRRKLSGFEWGGFASGQIDFFRADASFMRIETPNTLNGTPVNVGRAELCALGGTFGVCVDAMVFRGDAEMRAEASRIRTTTSQYVGLTVGITGL
jgi:hypothetical protein